MPATGDLIGPYRVISQLGRGAMGEVWRARDERLDRYVALKVLPADVAGDVERRARMLREARAAAAIRHPNVVTLYDIISHGGDDVLVMELVDGVTLSDALRQSGPPALEIGARLDPRRRRRARRRARPRHAASRHQGREHHGRGRDGEGARLRPREAAWRRRADSGPRAAAPARSVRQDRARRDDAEWRLGRRRQLPDPRRPAARHAAVHGARAGRRAPPDERSEVFSVGVLAYEILAGKPPYTASSIDALFEQILHTAPPALDKVPEAVARDRHARAREGSGAAISVDGDVPRCPRRRALAAVRTACTALAAGRRRRAAARGRRRGARVVALAPRATRTPRRRQGRARARGVQRLLHRQGAVVAARRARRRARSSARDRLPAPVRRPRCRARRREAGARHDGSPLEGSRAARRRDRARGARPTRRTQGAARRRCRVRSRARVLGRRARLPLGPVRRREGRVPRAARLSGARVSRPDLRSLLVGAALLRSTHGGARHRQALPRRVPRRGRCGRGLRDDARGGRSARRGGQDRRGGTAAQRGRGHARGPRQGPRAQGRPRSRARAVPALARASRGRRGVRSAVPRSASCSGSMAMPPPRSSRWSRASPARMRAPASAVPACSSRASSTPRAPRRPRSSSTRSRPRRPSYSPRTARRHRSRSSCGRVRSFFGGGCVVAPDDALHGPVDEAAYTTPLDFYAAYHVPFFATWAVCEHAALLAGRNEKARAADLLGPVATRAPNRRWLLEALRRYQP